MGAIFALYSLSYLLSTYLLARRRRVIIALLAATLLVQLTGFFIFHSSIVELMSVMAVSFSLLLAGSAVVARVGRGRVAPSTPPLADPPEGAGRGLVSGWRELVVADVVARSGGPRRRCSRGAGRWGRRLQPVTATSRSSSRSGGSRGPSRAWAESRSV